MPPVNDNFANATLISLATSVTIETDNTGATLEAGEPSHGENSIWYKVIADKDYSVTIDTSGSSYDTILAVYTGLSINSLTLEAYNDDDNNTLQSAVSLSLDLGKTYYIAVSGYDVSEYGYTKINLSAEVKRLFVEDTELQSTGFSLTPESSHYIGDDKYICICSVYYSGIGCVVVKVIDGIVVEKGVPIVVTTIGYFNTNPQAVWNGSVGALMSCDGSTIGGVGRWVTFSISGLSIIVLNSGSFTNNMSFIYGCNYNINADAGVICCRYSNAIRFITFRIAESVITSEYAAETVSVGNTVSDNVRIANCEDSCVMCFTKYAIPYIPEFRLASGLGSPSFTVSDGQTPFPSGAYSHLGFCGGSNGGFLYHCVGFYTSDPAIRYKNPCYVAGRVVAGEIVFGSVYEYEPEADVSSYVVGGIDYMSQGEFVSSFIVAYPDKIFIHKVKVEDFYDVSIVSSDNIPVDVYGPDYDHLSVSAKNDGNACVFYTDNTTRRIFVITSKFPVEAAIFWANRILHVEGNSGLVEKKSTVTVVPGNVGQPYVPPITAVPSRTVVEYFTKKECKKVG